MVIVAGRSTQPLGSMKTVLAAATIAVGSWISVPGGSWVPDVGTMDQIRGSLRPCVLERAARDHRELPAWSSYTFQYQGQFEGTAKVVFINAFCGDPPSYAAEHFVRVFDGGTCFFNLKYDPVQRRFFGLAFNGVA